MALVWTDPHKIGNTAGHDILIKLGERYYLLHTCGIVANVREVEKRIVLDCVQLPWNCLPLDGVNRSIFISEANGGHRLHVGFPCQMMCLKLIYQILSIEEV